MNINFLNKINTKKIIVLFVSILIVIIVLINSTYSLLVREDETEVQSYATGVLEITSEKTNNSITLTNSFPMSDSDGANSEPYTFKIENVGNLTYNFNVMLLSSSSQNQINANYIRLSADGGTPQTLGELTNGVFLSDITLYPGQSIEIELRVWLDENTKNSELGKVFNGKIVTEGQAIYKDSDDILTKLKLTVKPETPDFSKTSCTSNCEEETTGLYTSEDDYGTSYYFRGDVENNYVYFAGLYWRIIRINGNGSVRMIYSGTSPYDSDIDIVSTGDFTSSAFNSAAGNNMYLGYMYTSGNAHGTGTASTIKGVVDNFYTTKLKLYEEYLDTTVGFCNDRTYSTGTGIGQTNTKYGAYDRLSAGKSPSFKCTNSDDLFTHTTSTLGNKKLTYPIGLITADEVAYAGGKYEWERNEVNNFYLRAAMNYYTMSPYFYDTNSGSANMFIVGANGNLTRVSPTSSNYVRPVINLRGDLEYSGNGTATDPYVIKIKGSLKTLTDLQLTVSSGTPNFGQNATSNEGVFAAQDDLGISYYFRGSVTNNYVYFAGLYWRIIRINGDGTVRMIYDGTTKHNNGYSEDKHVTTNVFNSANDHNKYVGYMYGEDTSTYESTHSNDIESPMKIYLEDTWYTNTIKDTEYEQYVADAIYCNDRSLYSGTGLGQTTTTYKPWNRIRGTLKPILTCERQEDRFTYGESINGVLGNGKLDAPVGLITADEVMMAGAYSGINSSFYLYTGVNYWTMSPVRLSSNTADVVYVYSQGYQSNSFVTNNIGVRPVISLKAGVLKYNATADILAGIPKSDGTYNYPFQVITFENSGGDIINPEIGEITPGLGGGDELTGGTVSGDLSTQ